VQNYDEILRVPKRQNGLKVDASFFTVTSDDLTGANSETPS